jgi:acyl carrier protein
MSDTLSELNKVFRKVFRRPELSVTIHTTAADVERWDSFTHMQLIAEIEKWFSITFSYKEVVAFTNVGDMVTAIEQKTGVK